MFFKTSNPKKETEIKKEDQKGEEGKGENEQEREPCERCGSLEHIACIRPF